MKTYRIIAISVLPFALALFSVLASVPAGAMEFSADMVIQPKGDEPVL